jgi:hypothetical protein
MLSTAIKDYLTNWRGRRLLACQAIDTLDRVIANLAADDNTYLAPVGGLLTPPTNAMIKEMQNTAANLLRIILLWNDGSVSEDRLQRF